MKIHNIVQGGEEWHEIRKLKLTASHAQEISAGGKGLDTYTTNIIAEYFSQNEEERYINSDMERGHELEDEARTIYELENSVVVNQVGFIELDEYVGCSPDGLVGEDGGVEIKNHNNKVYSNLILTNNIESKYLWQIQMNLLITGRKWWDFVAYNPNFPKSIYLRHILPDPVKFAKLEAGVEKGKEMLKEKLEKMKNFMGETWKS